MWKVGRLIVVGSTLAAMLMFATTDAFAQKKKKKDDATPDYPQATEDDYAELAKKAKDQKVALIGKIATFDDKTITVRTEKSHQVPNPDYKPPSTDPKSRNYNAQVANLARQYANLQNAYKQAASKNPNTAASAQARIAVDMLNIQAQLARLLPNDPNNQPMKTVTDTKDYTFDLEDKVTYRKMFLPMEYDDEGNVKKYTDEEKLALRGDTDLPGKYKSKVDEVQPQQEAKVYLHVPKKKSKADEDASGGTVEHPTAYMVVLTKEAPTTSTTPAKDAQKKKKN